MDLEQLKYQHMRWTTTAFTSNGQREDSKTILALIERVEATEACVKEIEQEHLAEHAQCVKQHTENERLSERVSQLENCLLGFKEYFEAIAAKEVGAPREQIRTFELILLEQARGLLSRQAPQENQSSVEGHAGTSDRLAGLAETIHRDTGRNANHEVSQGRGEPVSSPASGTTSQTATERKWEIREPDCKADPCPGYLVLEKICSQRTRHMQAAQREVETLKESRPAIEEAVSVLVRELSADDGYRIAWKANIAMAYYDEFRHWQKSGQVTLMDAHAIANKAADNFLTMLCKVTPKETTPPAAKNIEKVNQEKKHDR